jgi:hypothetical protein
MKLHRKEEREGGREGGREKWFWEERGKERVMGKDQMHHYFLFFPRTDIMDLRLISFKH